MLYVGTYINVGRFVIVTNLWFIVVEQYKELTITNLNICDPKLCCLWYYGVNHITITNVFLSMFSLLFLPNSFKPYYLLLTFHVYSNFTTNKSYVNIVGEDSIM